MDLISLITGPVFGIINKLIPDPAAKAQMQLQTLQLAQAGEFKEIDSQLQRDLAQIDVDKTEAASPSLLKSGWRPGAGWVCVVGLAVQFLIAPLATWVATLLGHPVVFPPLDMGTLLTLLGGLLGLGTLRTMDKKAGVA